MPEADNDQYKTNKDDYEGLLNIDFMAQTVLPLNVVYPDVSSTGKVPQGTQSDIESDDNHLSQRKR